MSSNDFTAGGGPASADAFAAWGTPEPAAGFEQVATTAPVADAMALRQASMLERNGTAFITFAVVAAYVVLAKMTGIVLVGFVPAALAYRSMQRREPFAPLAVIAAVGAIAFSLTTLSHH